MFRRLALLYLVLAVASGLAWAGTTTLVSVATGGAYGNYYADEASISGDGRYVAFKSLASNLVTGDTNGCSDVFVRDRLNGTTTRISVATGGVQADDFSRRPDITADGRYVIFYSEATNLVAGDTNGTGDIFVHDRTTGTTSLVSVAPDGVQANDCPFWPSISADGRYVAFQSSASNLVTGDTNGMIDVFVHDRTADTTTRVSVSTGGVQANADCQVPRISADGRYVTFASGANTLVPGDTNGTKDVFVHDRTAKTTTRVSVASGGAQGDGNSGDPSLSADGRFVAFASGSSNLVTGGSNGMICIFVRDRIAGTTSRVSVVTGGAQANGDSYWPAISADGLHVAFMSSADNLAAGDTNGTYDIFVHDRTTGTTAQVSVATDGTQANYESWHPSVSANGRYVAFDSPATNLVAGDTALRDVFVRDTLDVNTPPTTPTSVTIAPTSPGPEKLTATATGSTDADGDSLVCQYQWSKKTGSTWSAWGNTGQTLAAGNVKIGEIWRVRARAFDGALYSAWKGGSSVTIVSMAGVTPAPKTYNVPVNSCVFVSFRWPVQQSSVTSRVQFKLGTTTVVSTSMTWITASRKVKLRPRVALKPNTYYRINIDPGIVCTSGRVLGWGENYWFKTAPATTTAAVTVAAAPTAAGAQVSLNLTSAATVRTVISNIAGRMIAELPERDLPAGMSSLLWNGRSNSGSKVPSGTYLVRVLATDSEGAQATAIAPLQMR